MHELDPSNSEASIYLYMNVCMHVYKSKVSHVWKEVDDIRIHLPIHVLQSRTPICAFWHRPFLPFFLRA